jgi:excisionase family DNA binding protein
MNTLPKLHRINDAAAALGVSRNTIYRLAREGKLVRIQIGENSSRITDDSIREFVVAGTVATPVSSRRAGPKAAPDKGVNLHST